MAAIVAAETAPARGQFYNGLGSHPFKAGFENFQPISEVILSKLHKKMLGESPEDQDARWAKLKEKFQKILGPEAREFAPHIKAQLFWLHKEPTVWMEYDVLLSDRAWLTTPVEWPVDPQADKRKIRTRLEDMTVSEIRGRAAHLGAQAREHVEEILGDPSRDNQDKGQKIAKTLGNFLEPAPGVTETELMEACGLIQTWKPIEGRRGINLGRLALIEQVCQSIPLLAQTHQGKAGEFCQLVKNLCNGQPLTSELNVYVPNGGASRRRDNRGGFDTRRLGQSRNHSTASNSDWLPSYRSTGSQGPFFPVGRLAIPKAARETPPPAPRELQHGQGQDGKGKTEQVEKAPPRKRVHERLGAEHPKETKRQKRKARQDTKWEEEALKNAQEADLEQNPRFNRRKRDESPGLETPYNPEEKEAKERARNEDGRADI
jgi:hypothetical protein